MAMEDPLELAIVTVDVAVELGERKRATPDGRREAARFDIGDRLIIGRPLDGLPLHDVARLEQAHEIAQIADLLIGIVGYTGNYVCLRPRPRADCAWVRREAVGEVVEVFPGRTLEQGNKDVPCPSWGKVVDKSFATETDIRQKW